MAKYPTINYTSFSYNNIAKFLNTKLKWCKNSSTNFPIDILLMVMKFEEIIWHLGHYLNMTHELQKWKHQGTNKRGHKEILYFYIYICTKWDRRTPGNQRFGYLGKTVLYLQITMKSTRTSRNNYYFKGQAFVTEQRNRGTWTIAY